MQYTLASMVKYVAYLGLVALAGCATPGHVATPIPVTKTRTFDAPFDMVWPAIVGGVAEANLRVTTLEKASGLIAISDTAYAPSDGSEGERGTLMGVPEEVVSRVANVNIFATRPSESKTNVRVNVSLKMQIRSGNGSQMFPIQYRWEQAYSNGNIERAIFEGIAARIKQQQKNEHAAN